MWEILFRAVIGYSAISRPALAGWEYLAPIGQIEVLYIRSSTRHIAGKKKAKKMIAWAALVIEAIQKLNAETGSSRTAIRKFLMETYKVRFNTLLF